VAFAAVAADLQTGPLSGRFQRQTIKVLALGVFQEALGPADEI
jgi:hypothetical protein